jgi:hypothetical protein
MQWSRLRATVRDLLAPSVAGRVDVHMAGYGSSSTDRAWLALDGRDVLTIPEYYRWHAADGMEAARLSPARPEGVLLHEGRVSTIGTLLHRYLESGFAEIVASPTVFLRGFARFDRRFGKRRLAAPPPPDEHPFVVHCHLFRAAAEGLVAAAGSPPDAARWHLPRQRAAGSPAVRARADAALRAGKDRSFAALVQRCRDGAVDAPPLPAAEPPAAPRLRAAFAARGPADAEILAAELRAVGDRCDIGADPSLAAGLVSLLACAAPRLRPPESWAPSTHNAARQFASLARHLYARHDLPRFLDRAWTEGDGREQGWFIFLGDGGSLRHAPGLPVSVSRSVAGWFLRAPDDCPVEPALRWAEVRAAGGSVALADAVRRTRLGRDYSHPEFWAEVIRFFVANPLLDPEQAGAIVDWIQAQRFEPEIAPGQALPEEGAVPPRPGLSMRGRTVEATLREVEAWHRRLGRAAPDTLALAWAPSGIAGHESVEGTRPEERRVWRIREITTGEGLVREGERMSHCVASYARSCAAGASSIWTLECTVAVETQPRLTIQVHPASRRIGQARGRHNRAPTAAELAIVARWAAAAGLTLDVAPVG